MNANTNKICLFNRPVERITEFEETEVIFSEVIDSLTGSVNLTKGKLVRSRYGELDGVYFAICNKCLEQQRQSNQHK